MSISRAFLYRRRFPLQKIEAGSSTPAISPPGEIFLALPFGLLLTILFWFDHNVSSLIAQGSEFPLRKPPGFHWDIFLLGLTTFIAGILGIPFPNGLIPQAPFHTNSLCVTKLVSDPDEDNKGKVTRVTDHVVEQRVSNLAQGTPVSSHHDRPTVGCIASDSSRCLGWVIFRDGVPSPCWEWDHTEAPLPCKRQGTHTRLRPAQKH